MLKNGKYRFSLQFGAENEKQLRAGNFLERLGNRKSMVIVEALNEYLNAHPEIASANPKIEVKLASGAEQGRLETLIRKIVEEKLKTITLSKIQTEEVTEQSRAFENDVARMLENIDLFN